MHVVLIVSFTYECYHTDSNSEASGNSHMLCGVLEASSGGALEPRGNRLSEELWDAPLTLQTELEQQTCTIWRSDRFFTRLERRGQWWKMNSSDRSSGFISIPQPEKWHILIYIHTHAFCIHTVVPHVKNQRYEMSQYSRPALILTLTI